MVDKGLNLFVRMNFFFKNDFVKFIFILEEKNVVKMLMNFLNGYG